MKQGDIKRGGKTKEKLALAERKAMLARNDYIMTLAASNAFKQRYFGVEMPNVVDVLDQNFHDCLRQILLLYRQLCDQFGALIFGMLVGGGVGNCFVEVFRKFEQQKRVGSPSFPIYNTI